LKSFLSSVGLGHHGDVGLFLTLFPQTAFSQQVVGGRDVVVGILLQCSEIAINNQQIS